FKPRHSERMCGFGRLRPRLRDFCRRGPRGAANGTLRYGKLAAQLSSGRYPRRAYRPLLPGSASAMLGRDHALSGAVVVAALAPSLHVTAAHLAAGVVLGAGAGVLPDIDHPHSTIARSFAFLTEWFAWVVDRISGGHRR